MGKGTRAQNDKDTPRAARLKSALKANLARRKAQARARAGDDTTETPTATGKNPAPRA